MVDVSGVLGAAGEIGFRVLIVLAFGGGGMVLAWFINNRVKYNIPVRIFTFDGFGNPVQQKDVGGVFVNNRTKHKRFWLKKNKGMNLDPDKIKPISSGKGRVVYMVKYSEKDWRYLDMNLSPNPGFSVNIGEQEVNWWISEKARWEKVIFPDKLLAWLPWIGLFFIGIIFVIVVVTIFNKFEIFQVISDNIREAAASLAQAKTGQAVIDV